MLRYQTTLSNELNTLIQRGEASVQVSVFVGNPETISVEVFTLSVSVARVSSTPRSGDLFSRLKFKLGMNSIFNSEVQLL